MRIQQEAEGKGDGTSQATVRDDELIFGGQLDDAEVVDYKCKTNHTCKKEKKNTTQVIFCVSHTTLPSV